MVPGNWIKEWGLIRWLGLLCLIHIKVHPILFYQQINNNQQRKEKEAKRKENQPLTHS
jgi:hypothetical protein